MNIVRLLILAILFFAPPVFASEEFTVAHENAHYQGKILGGIESKAGDWPWIAALLYTNESDMYLAQFCSGVLIDHTWILTAAHCVYDMSASEVDIAVGAFDLTNFSDNRISVKNILIHPQYNATKLINDIALLQLNGASNGSKIHLFAGESREAIPPALLGKTLTVIGWGMADNSSYPEKLRQVDLPVVVNQYCNDIYSPPLLASQICAGYYEGKDACNGDSGGPVVTKIDGAWVHVGLTSFGKSCESYNGWYGVYTRTSSFVSFINQYVPGASFWIPPAGSIVPILQLLLSTQP